MFAAVEVVHMVEAVANTEYLKNMIDSCTNCNRKYLAITMADVNDTSVLKIVRLV